MNFYSTGTRLINFKDLSTVMLIFSGEVARKNFEERL